jgi:TetR/AcrR family transcriptional repressor of nem operon
MARSDVPGVGSAGGRDGTDTATRVLDVAERLVQTRGFNGFSYGDVAREVGVSTAALHYHFAGKAELGEALITRYARRFSEALAEVNAGSARATSRLDAYANLYLAVLEDHRMCLCGMLAAEFETLPAPADVLEQGRGDGAFDFSGPAREVARMIVSSLEGAMLVARPFGDVTAFQVSARRLLEGLRTDRGHGTAPASEHERSA